MISKTLICKNNFHPILIKNFYLNPLFLKITFNHFLIKEKNLFKKIFFWTILLKIKFWDNFIYKTNFGQLLLF